MNDLHADVAGVLIRLRTALSTAEQDDRSGPQTEKRIRHIARVMAMEDAATLIERLSAELAEARRALEAQIAGHRLTAQEASAAAVARADARSWRRRAEAAERLAEERRVGLEAILADIELLQRALREGDPDAEIQVRVSDVLAYIRGRAGAES